MRILHLGEVHGAMKIKALQIIALLLSVAAGAAAFELPGGGQITSHPAPPSSARQASWRSGDGRLSGAAPVAWRIEPHQGTTGLKMTMDINGNSVLRYRDTRPRPNAFRATLRPDPGTELEFEAYYKPLAYDDHSDPWLQCAAQLRRALESLTFMKATSGIDRIAPAGATAGLAVSLIDADSRQSTLRRLSVIKAGSIVYEMSVQVSGTVTALQQCSTGLALLTSTVAVHWPQPNPQIAQRLPGIHRRLVAEGDSAVSTEGEIFLMFDGNGFFADARNTSTAAVARTWTGDVASWATVHNPGLIGRGRYLVIDGFLLLLYDWVREAHMDKFSAYPLTFGREGIELDYRVYQRLN